MIKLDNVTKKYGNFYAIRNISFEVNDGEIVGFLGRNGAGKTTTMNIITGFIESTSGDVIVNGYDINIKPQKAKAQIGYMPEGTPLYSELTVKEFITYMAELRLVPRKERKAAIEYAIKSTGLEKVQDDLTRNLSRGYKQRVSLAGAMVGNPKILILDEPTVGLDPKQVVEIRNLIKEFGKDHTILISSHILSEISQICDKVIVIDKGEIIAVDTPENLEKQTTMQTTLTLLVDDMSNSVEAIADEIKEITSIELVKENDDHTKEYLIKTSTDSDVRKKVFACCAKREITILELKKHETSLEDTFIKLIENRKEYSQKEINKMQYEKEIDDLRIEELQKKEEKANRKQAIKEEKARKVADKEAKKEEKLENKAEEVKEENVESKAEEIKEENVENKVEEVKENEVESKAEEIKEENSENKTEEVKENEVENKNEGGDK